MKKHNKKKCVAAAWVRVNETGEKLVALLNIHTNTIICIDPDTCEDKHHREIIREKRLTHPEFFTGFMAE